MLNDRITLRAEEITVNENGYKAYTYTDTEVWARKKSVVRSEFYTAGANGIELSIAFEVNADEYDGQKAVLYDGKQYNVVRTYQIGQGLVELNCSDKAV